MSSPRHPQWGPRPAPKHSSRARRYAALAAWFAILAMPDKPAIVVPVITVLVLGAAIRIYLDLRRI